MHAQPDGQADVLVPPVYDILWTVVGLGVPALLLAVLVLLAVRATRRPPAPSRAAAAARRHAAVVHVAAWTVAVVALPLLGYGALPGLHAVLRAYARSVGGSGFLGGGVLVGLTPAGVGLAFLLVHAVGELTWPRPSGTLRRASLRPRAVRDVAPPRVRRLTWTWAALLAVTLAGCALVAEPDGRSVARTFLGGAATHSPFPGWFYGLPLLVAAGLVLAGQEVVLRLVTRRAAVADAADAWDLGLRRLSAHRVLRGTQLVLGATAGAVLVVAGVAVRGLGDVTVDGATPSGSTAYLLGGTALAVVGLAVLVVAVALTLQQGDAAVAPAPADDAAAAVAR
ncbi:hypothetical protein [Actinotalea solisilvae]|uniref:hypothetical protein n=1 Tax=Actinotalea solisilvae TaxID=2072922 RepID=UPI0018F14368|nr:hypothetical protein [Actinotalea solisilvae]